MFIAIVGTRLAGKSTVESYLVKHKGFLPVKILQNLSDKVPEQAPGSCTLRSPVLILQGRRDASSDDQSLPVGAGKDAPFGENDDDDDLDKLSFSEVGFNPSRVSFLTMTSPISSCLPSPAPGQVQVQPLLFRSPAELLAHITKNWRTNFVTIDLDTREVLAEFMTRPFVLVLAIDAPLLTRYRRSMEWSVSSRWAYLTLHFSVAYPFLIYHVGPTQATPWKNSSENMMRSTTAR